MWTAGPDADDFMFRLTLDGIWYLGLFLEGFLYGFYSGIFAIYVQYQASKQNTGKTRKILFYSMCTLYVTCGFLFSCDIATCICFVYRRPDASIPNFCDSHILMMQTALFACSDFIAQFILIYRCWIVWGHNICIVIIPSILAFTFLAVTSWC